MNRVSELWAWSISLTRLGSSTHFVHHSLTNISSFDSCCMVFDKTGVLTACWWLIFFVFGFFYFAYITQLQWKNILFVFIFHQLILQIYNYFNFICGNVYAFPYHIHNLLYSALEISQKKCIYIRQSRL